MKPFLLLFAVVCLAAKAACQQYRIHGTISGFEDGIAFRLDDMETQQTISTTKILKGEFTLTGTLVATPRQVMLVAFQQGKIYYRRMIIGNESVKMEGDITGFPWRIKVIGSATQDIYNPLDEKMAALYGTRDSMLEVAKPILNDQSPVAKQTLLDMVRGMAVIDSQLTVMKKAFILSKPDTYPALCELYYARKSYSRDSLMLLYNSFSPALRASLHGSKIAAYLEAGKPLETGDAYMDFEAQDSSGRKHRLSASAGKYILLDFTETDCMPCMKAVPELTKLAGQYKDQLSIVSFTADARKETWLRGLKRDHPSWLSLWDGKGTSGEVCLKYGISAYPSFVLIDPKGKIIARWQGYGEGSIEGNISRYIRL